METRHQYRFGKDVIDPQEIVALIGNTLILGDGKEHCVDDATADAVRRAFIPYPEPKQISLTVPGMVNREDVADGAMPGVSPQRPYRAPKPGCEGQGLTSAKATAQ